MRGLVRRADVAGGRVRGFVCASKAQARPEAGKAKSSLVAKRLGNCNCFLSSAAKVKMAACPFDSPIVDASVNLLGKGHVVERRVVNFVCNHDASLKDPVRCARAWDEC